MKEDEHERTIRAVMDDVVRYAQFRLGSREDAEDVAMETWHALRKLGPEIHRAQEPRHYAIGVCRRKIADFTRKRAPQSTIGESEVHDPQSERTMLVRMTLGKLSEEHREVLALRYFFGYSTEETAALIGRTPTATNSLVQRAREAFAAHASWYPEDQP